MAIGTSRLRIGLFSGLLYFVLAAIAINPVHNGVATFWPATPVLLALLLARSRRKWNAILIGATIGSLLASSLFGFGVVSAIRWRWRRSGRSWSRSSCSTG